MTKEDYRIAKELKKKLSKIVKILDFRVFGSRARGDAKRNSDMDVFIEVPTLNKSLKKKIRHVAWEVSFEHLIFISSRIFSKNQIEHSPLMASPLIQNIFEEGIKI